MTLSRRLGAGLALATVLFLPPPPAFAQGIPVNDSAAIAQLIAQITSLTNIYTRQNLELQRATRLVQSPHERHRLRHQPGYGGALRPADGPAGRDEPPQQPPRSRPCNHRPQRGVCTTP